MAAPNTPLMSAPHSLTDPFGKAISSTDLITGLQKINPNIRVPLPDHFGWYPGKEQGMTCLWLGEPGEPKSIKISAFHLGSIPEWTLYDGNAKEILRKGWRSIFSKCIKARACSQRRLEGTFQVSLEYAGMDGWCVACFREGNRNKATSQGNKLCNMHHDVSVNTRRISEKKKEARWDRDHPTKPMGPTVGLLK